MRLSGIHAEVERFVGEQFAFLIDEKGYRSGPIKRVPGGFTDVTYLGERLGFNLYIEFRDPTVIAGLINVQADTSATTARPGAFNVQMKRPLLGALRNTLHVVDTRMDQISRMNRTDSPWGIQVYKDIILLDAGLIRDYIDALSALPVEALFPPETPQAT